jgi:hypothetical protein
MSMHRLRGPALLAALGEECGPPWYKGYELLSAGRKTVGLIELADLAID